MNQIMHKSRLIFLTSAITAILTTSVLASARQEVAGQETPNGLTPEQVAEVQAIVKKLSGQIESMNDVKAKLSIIAEKGDALSIEDMFEIQFLINRLTQLSETTSILNAAAQEAILSIISNFNG
jgi:Family of unknown function (DUF5407)